MKKLKEEKTSFLVSTWPILKISVVVPWPTWRTCQLCYRRNKLTGKWEHLLTGSKISAASHFEYRAKDKVEKQFYSLWWTEFLWMDAESQSIGTWTKLKTSGKIVVGSWFKFSDKQTSNFIFFFLCFFWLVEFKRSVWILLYFVNI